MAAICMPEIPLSSGGKNMPALGLGTAAFPLVEPEVVVQAVLEAIKLGIRHFDTAVVYATESSLGDAIAEALKLGLIKSRDELFITSKIWCSDAHPDRVVPALKQSLRNLKLDYLDLYLIHWPVLKKPMSYDFPPKKETFLPFDAKLVWPAMEECYKLGLAKSIGVANFSTKKLGDLLSYAKIPPAVNQVMSNPLWNQKKLVEFCKQNGVLFEAYSPLGASGTIWGSNLVLENEVLNEIAKAKGKSIAQICLRWQYQRGVAVIFKSYNKDRLKQNLEIFGWELSLDETKKIDELPPTTFTMGAEFVAEDGPIKSLHELWDGYLLS